MTLGAFLCVLWMRDEEGRPVETIDSLSGLAQTRPAFAAAFAIFMFSLAGIPPLFGFWPKLLVFRAAVASGYVALAVAGILGTVVGAYYYLKIVKVMYMDEPAAPYERVREPVQGLLILLAALARVAPRLSADRPARHAHRQARRDRSSEPHPDRRADRLDQCRPACRSATPSKATGWSRSSRSGQGPAGPRVGFGHGQFLRQHAGPAARRRSAAADAVAGRRPRADRSDRCRGSRARR